MAVMPQTFPVRIERLGPSSMIEATRFLDRDPVLNVFLEALILRDGLAHPRDEFWAARRGEEIAALLFLGMDGGLVAPVGDDAQALEALARWAVARSAQLPSRRHLVGAQAALAAFEPEFTRRLPPPRLVRNQVYMSMGRRSLGRHRLPQLRPAEPADEALVFASGIALRREELEEDPLRVDEAAYRRHVQSECRQGNTYLWRVGDQLRFRATIGALSTRAAQVSAVYTPPEFRNQGIATRALGELCHRLFQHVDHVCLFVNDFNRPALAVYLKLGFGVHAPWRSLFWGPRA